MPVTSELGVGEPVGQPDLPGLHLERRQHCPSGSVSVSDGLFLLGCDRGRPGRSGPTAAGPDGDRGEFLDDRAGLRVDQPDDPVAARRGQELAVGPEETA